MPENDLASKPVSLSYTEAAGERVLIHGGAGGVGGAAVQLVRWKGEYVITTASARNHDYLGARGEILARLPTALRKGGRLVSIAGRLPEATCATAGIECATMLMDASGVEPGRIGELVDSGQSRIHLDAVFPLERAADAPELNRERHTRGRIVLEVRE